MEPKPTPPSRKSAFFPVVRLLLEAVLIQVIIFGGLYLWVMYLVNQHFQNLSRALARGIACSIEAYYQDHLGFPLPGMSTSSPHDTDTDTSPTHPFTSRLRGHESALPSQARPHSPDYLELAENTLTGRHLQSERSIQDPTTGHHGITGSHNLPFRIRLDTNRDNQVSNPNSTQASADRPILRARVLVWSAGKDGNWDTWVDNPMSWD